MAGARATRLAESPVRRSVASRGAERTCVALARQQHGVFSRAQARQAGLSRWAIDRRVTSGRWERLHPDVFRIAGTPGGWEQDLMAACLHAGPGAAVSHRAAAALWELEGVEPSIVEIISPRRIRTPGIVAHQTWLPRRRTTSIGPIPVTDPARTLLDLGAVARAATVEAALDDALRRRLTSLPSLARRLAEDGGRGRRGAGVLRPLLAARDPAAAPPESILEARFARLLSRSGLPRPIAQYEVREGRRLIGRVDFAWPEAMVALEVDGYRHHSSAAAWRRDRSRGNALTGRGWRVLHVTSDDLSNPEAFLAEMRRTLAPGVLSTPRRG